MSTPASVSDGEKDRRSALQVAILGVAAVLIAALIGVGASLITTDLTGRNSAKEARDDFLRSQRQIAYAAFIADESALERTEDVCSRAEQPTDKTPTAQAIFDDVETAYNKLSIDLSAIQVLRGGDTPTYASDVTDAHAQASFDCEVALKLTSLLAMPAPPAESFDALLADENKARRALDKFITEASTVITD